MSADERLAIWRCATREERQRVIDAPQEPAANWDIFLPTQVFVSNAGPCCPWGMAFHGSEEAWHELHSNPAFPEVHQITAVLVDRAYPDDSVTFDPQAYDATYDSIERMADSFVARWDAGEITPDDLIAFLRRLNEEEATQ